MDETRITGDLPNMHIEITRTAEPDGSAEHMTIHLTATPNFQAALPLPLMMLSPMLAWQNMMAPWMTLMGVKAAPPLCLGLGLGLGEKAPKK